MRTRDIVKIEVEAITIKIRNGEDLTANEQKCLSCISHLGDPSKVRTKQFETRKL